MNDFAKEQTQTIRDLADEDVAAVAGAVATTLLLLLLMLFP